MRAMSGGDGQPQPLVPGLSTPIGTRRAFFRWVTTAAAGLIGMGLGIPLIGYVISPALKRREQPWVEVGVADDLPVGIPKQLEYVRTIQDGWMASQTHKAVWAVKQADGQVTVLSPICTHLGCGHRWDDADRKFKCPCHGSVYDAEGKVLAGPAPRRLDVLPSKIESGKLFVIYKEFKAGLSTSVEL
jgi:menaquinol-cytochrome c reductase iron-sulfur subunit